MKIISLLIGFTLADMASYNRYRNTIVSHGMGQERASTEYDSLLEYKLKLAQRLIKSSTTDSKAMKKLGNILIKLNARAPTVKRNKRYQSRFVAYHKH